MKCQEERQEEGRGSRGRGWNPCYVDGVLLYVHTHGACVSLVQELLPLVVTFSIPLPSEVDQNAPEIQQISLQYNVAIHLKPVCVC